MINLKALISLYKKLKGIFLIGIGFKYIYQLMCFGLTNILCVPSTSACSHYVLHCFLKMRFVCCCRVS